MLKGIDYCASNQKRALDLALSVPLSAIFSPVIIAGATAARLTMRQPGIYLEPRVDAGSKDFKVYKIRTAADLCDNTQPPPVKGVACLIRQLGIDELPQLWNVIDGDMSMVGWRPMDRAMYDKMLNKLPGSIVDEWKAAYDSVKPGIISHHAINIHSGEKDRCIKRAESDLRYIENASTRADLSLLSRMLNPKTLKAMASAAGL